MWKSLLDNTGQTNVNYKSLGAIGDLSTDMVAKYVDRTLDLLDGFTDEDPEIIDIVRTVLQWSDVAKCGTDEQRADWIKRGYNLNIHNLGSAEIYKQYATDYSPIVYTLIKTHGLVGQYVMGEVNIDVNREIYDNIEMPIDKLRRLLQILNFCVVDGVRPGLYERRREDLDLAIDRIVAGDFETADFTDPGYIIYRIKKLRQGKSGDDYQDVEKLLNNDKVCKKIGDIFAHCQMWYFYSALSDFNPGETVKIFLLLYARMGDASKYPHISFQSLMRNMYRDYNGIRTIDLFKKRIMESYLRNLNIEDLANGVVEFNKHISGDLYTHDNVTEFVMSFSPLTQKMIEFVEASYGEDETYNRAIMMLYDLFGFRRDAYDRFYNEGSYLKTMNASMTHKAKIADYINGPRVLDIGPGGGALMDIILEKHPDADVWGIDLSQNVIESLAKRKADTGAKWNMVRGDALNLIDSFERGSFDAVIYSSIIHELFSYIETDGRKFNYDTIKNALESAYEILNDGGRIIIRDGVMTEPADADRIIEFIADDGMDFLKNYVRDFKGRAIKYTDLGNNRIMMKVNDAMEFLYTYTWGSDSYAHEVNEQFGYFTPTGFTDFFKQHFDGRFQIIELKHFLQEGYEENLLQKIKFMDTDGNATRLPDSTCILVARAIKK